MSKKLLEESTIRSFMKLANLQPLSEKFISEKYGMKEEEEHEEEKEDEDKKEVDESAPPDTEETAHSRDRLEEEEKDEGEVQEEGKESEGRPASKKEAPKGTSLAGKAPSKMDAAKNAPGDAKLNPAKKTNHHSDKPDSIETKGHSNAPKKNNSQFEVVSESLEEMEEPTDSMEEEMDAPEGGDMGSAGESPEHKEKMKDLINNMLDTLKNMASEYGVEMDISRGDESAAPPSPEGDAEMVPPAGEEAMQEKLDEMVEKLTKRVAARLVKESKKKR